jgi:hypothetical protein
MFRLKENLKLQVQKLVSLLIEGAIETRVTSTPQTRTYESCQIPHVVRHCVVTNGVVHCYDHTSYYEGQREVYYHMTYTNREISVNLVDVNNKDELAELKSTGTIVQKVDDYVGPCLLGFPYPSPYPHPLPHY